MSVAKTHLSTERLSIEATAVAAEIAEHLEKVDPKDMHRVDAPNFYYYKSPALFELVRRLVKELPFITQKVLVSNLYFAQ